MKISFLLLLLTLTTLINNRLFAQNQDSLLVAFWNLENLFDTKDDPDKNDEQFLPDGDREWTDERLDQKLFKLARVIRSMNNYYGADILGVCEVEHQSVLELLTSKFLSDINYKIAYLESPDNRGIDNGLIYNADKFFELSVSGDTVHLADDWPTRLILKVKLLTKWNDTLSVYVNHWPSRSRGRELSEPNRINAAETVRKSVDKEFSNNPNAKIVIIGDFNDEPSNISIHNYLKALELDCKLPESISIVNSSDLYNISYSTYNDSLGTYLYKGDWNMLDQIILSGDLIINPELKYICNSFEIYKPHYLVTQSGNYKGAAFPTFGGRNYLGGYSDHFPVVAKFFVGKH
jgi:endonuclease/exonuclease/phosphatase family metal-dependent hydrolase